MDKELLAQIDALKDAEISSLPGCGLANLHPCGGRHNQFDAELFTVDYTCSAGSSATKFVIGVRGIHSDGTGNHYREQSNALVELDLDEGMSQTGQLKVFNYFRPPGEWALQAYIMFRQDGGTFQTCAREECTFDVE
ncbi:hypothetical protein Pan97_39240 [Bremerella volcania]|uniref:Uncharacterized protein n=1 Tax=Bremerella volcania TaxID=2527984 RepID=A0A518CCB9_9BACT|nr:hypothetical protein [Bremerella volcania]QDU76867.1 hypothetical protein Pan97_39240 [Bremerella volcania]